LSLVPLRILARTGIIGFVYPFAFWQSSYQSAGDLEWHWDREIHKPQTRNVSKARALGATLEALFLIAAFCRLAKLLNYSKQMGWLVGAVGIEHDPLFLSPAI